MDQASLSTLANRLAAHLEGRGVLSEPLRCAEIGARKPLDRSAGGEPFYDLDKKLILGFEADAIEADRLNMALGPDSPIRMVGAAVGGRDDEVDLYLTRNPKCSSLYRPNEAFIARYPGLEVASLDRIVRVRGVTLASALASAGWPDLHLLKMDIQGAELDVVEGAGPALDRVVTLVTEVSFQPIYEAAPLAEDVFAALRRRGFELYRLLTQGGLARASARHDQMQVLWSDALFFRTPETLERADAARLAVFATLYGALDVSECALAQVGDAEQAWFTAQIRQPWHDRISDARAQLRRFRKGLTRRARMLGGFAR